MAGTSLSSAAAVAAIVILSSLRAACSGEECKTISGFGLITPNNAFPVVPGEEDTGPAYRNGFGRAFGVNITKEPSPSSQIVGTYRGVEFVTGDSSGAHLSAHFKESNSNGRITFQGFIDLATGYGEYAVAGGNGVYTGASGRVIESLVSSNTTTHTRLFLLRIYVCH